MTERMHGKIVKSTVGKSSSATKVSFWGNKIIMSHFPQSVKVPCTTSKHVRTRTQTRLRSIELIRYNCHIVILLMCH